MVHDLTEGSSLNLGNVSEYSVNEPGTHMAYLVDAKDDAGNGLYLLDLSSNAITPLETDQASYEDLTWDEDGERLAAFRGEVPEGKVERANTLLVLRDLDRPSDLQRLDPTVTDGFPDGFVLSERGGITWADESDRIFVGIKEQADERPLGSHDERAKSWRAEPVWMFGIGPTWRSNPSSRFAPRGTGTEHGAPW